MALDITVKDIIQMVIEKFVHAFLPDAKTPYTLRTKPGQSLSRLPRNTTKQKTGKLQ
jgi:hypothetical protein